MSFQYHYCKYSKALYLALLKDPFYATMETSVANGSPKESLMKYLDYSIAEGKKYGQIHTPNDHDYGISVWLMPQTAEKEEEKKAKKRQFLINEMGGRSLKV